MRSERIKESDFYRCEDIQKNLLSNQPQQNH